MTAADESSRIALHYRVERLLADYVACIDEDRLEDWPDHFAEQCHYEIKPLENHRDGLPIPLMLCDSRGMLQDRVVALRKANVYQPHRYRHFVSGLQVEPAEDGSIRASANYLIVQTLQDGETRVFQTGRYHDEIVEIEGSPRVLKFRRKLAIYDTSRVQTLLVTPV